MFDAISTSEASRQFGAEDALSDDPHISGRYIYSLTSPEISGPIFTVLVVFENGDFAPHNSLVERHHEARKAEGTYKIDRSTLTFFEGEQAATLLAFLLSPEDILKFYGELVDKFYEDGPDEDLEIDYT